MNSASIVILSGGEAVGRDLTSAGGFDVVDGKACGACSVLDLVNCIADG